jgi:tetratricopeptide (TPR) repeat protein
MISPSRPAELEITLSHREGGEYDVRMRYTPPGSRGFTDPLGGRPARCRIDFEGLRRCLLDHDAYGRALTAGLFADPAVGLAFAEVLASTAGAPLRVSLIVDGDAPELHALRWELLGDPRGDAPLFIGQRCSLSRQLPPRGVRGVPPRSRQHLRGLVVVANPSDLSRYAPAGRSLSRIDVAGERRRAEDALRQIKPIILASGDATLRNLTRHLQDGPDIVHLVCHGALIAGQPRLWLENEAGESDVVDGEELARRIERLAQPPLLIVLVSCQSAGDGGGHDTTGQALAALGPRLASAGVSAVLGMQGNVSMQTMDTLLPAFFGELLAGGQIDHALAVARQSVSDRPDWWMPALFMSLKEGQLALSLNPRYVSTLPPPPADFTGRAAELADLLERAARGGAFITGLRGMGGIGKTALALVVAEQIAPRYPDAALYLDLGGASDAPLSPRDLQAQVIRAFDREARIPDADTELADLYRATLSGKAGLLVLDDARHPGQVRPVLPPAGWAVLVTSRQHFSLPGLDPINLDALHLEDARRLLQTIAPRLTDAEADQIARLCGRLPLALRLAGGALQSRPGLSPDAYIRRLGREAGRIELLDDESRLDPTSPSIQATLAISYGFLTPDLRDSWRSLAVFPASFDVQAAAAVWDLATRIDPSNTDHQAALDRASDTLDHLVRYSALETDQPGRYRLHDLARLFAARLLTDEEGQSLDSRLADHYLWVLAATEELYLEGGESVLAALATFDLERPGIEAGQAWAASHAGGVDEAAWMIVRYPLVAANLLGLRLRPRLAIGWLESAIVAARRLGDRSNEAAILRNFGNRYAELGDARRAIDLYEQALEIDRGIPNRPNEGSDLTGLANRYAQLGEHRRAIKLYEQALVIARQFGDRRGEGRRLYNVSFLRADQGNLTAAIEAAEAGLPILEELEDPAADGLRKGLAQWRTQFHKADKSSTEDRPPA